MNHDQAMAKLREELEDFVVITTCHCDHAYVSVGRHEPNANCYSHAGAAEALAALSVISDALREAEQLRQVARHVVNGAHPRPTLDGSIEWNPCAIASAALANLQTAIAASETSKEEKQ